MEGSPPATIRAVSSAQWSLVVTTTKAEEFELGLVTSGVGLTPQEAEEGQTPQKLRLERGKEANDSQFPLESHFSTTNFMN